MQNNRSLRFALLALTATLTSCSLAPDFVKPQMTLPASYKEDSNAVCESKGFWKRAEKLEASQRGQWWKLFGDTQLDTLEEQAATANPTLKAAAARVDEARGAVRANASSYLPDLDLGGNAARAKTSSASLAAFGGSSGVQLKPYTLYSANAAASYEADLFGSVRNNEHAFSFLAKAQEATYRSVLLALQADVAQNYFALRALDKERQLVRDDLSVQTEGARILQKRFDAGDIAEQDYRNMEAELSSTEAALVGLERQRKTLEHALSTLLGKMPAEFSFADAPLAGNPPQIPAGLPSTLLERRPDVAAAEAAMEAANARIGVARAAFFPDLTLTASGGYESTTLGDLFNWSSRAWALGQLAGTALTWNVFDSGRNNGRLDSAKAAYEESVQNYRAQALTAFREVEDNLADQHLLVKQSGNLSEAATSSARATSLTKQRYTEGAVDYFQVVEAERVSLAAGRTSVQAEGQRFFTAVSLIRTLGGGWEAEETANATPAEEESSSEK